MLFFPLKYPNLLRNLQLWLPPASLPSLTPQFIKSYPFPQHPYFGQPCLHNLNLPIAKGTFCLFKKKERKAYSSRIPIYSIIKASISTTESQVLRHLKGNLVRQMMFEFIQSIHSNKKNEVFSRARQQPMNFACIKSLHHHNNPMR